jgi:high affinity sulfate transporter 1
VSEQAAAIRPAGGLARFVPSWIRGYRRAWLPHDVVAGIVIWSVVVPQAVAYAQIANLPPEAGLAAAPGALVAYSLLGSSRTLVVSATTATSAVSASAVGAIVSDDPERFAALSATFALMVAVVLIGAGMLRIGGVSDLVSKPVMTGFLFGLGLTITVGQLPKLLGVASGEGHFFQSCWDLLTELDDIHWWTFATGAASIVALFALRRFFPNAPGTIIVLVGAIVISAALDLSSHGVEVVGELPKAYPRFDWPDFRAHDLLELIGPAIGVLLLTTEAVGVSRAIAALDGYNIDSNRELVAIGGSNALAGLSHGFVQSGGASQTMAAENAGGKSQLASVLAAGLIVLTGLFLGGLFKDLPQATLGAIIIVAISGFFRVDELRRFAHLRRSAIVFALVALVGVLLFGVLSGLIVAAGLSLITVIQRISRPRLSLIERDAAGRWSVADPKPGAMLSDGFLFTRVDGSLFYANAVSIKDRVLALVRAESSAPKVVVLDLSETPDLDVGSADMLDELRTTLEREGIELRLANVHAPVAAILERSGLAGRVQIAPTLDAAARP